MAYTETRRQRDDALRTQLEAPRGAFLTHWKELGDFISPRRVQLYSADANRGERRGQKIIDPTATLAARTLQAGMMSGLTSPARPWFQLTTPDADLNEYGAVKQWLHTVGERMATAMLGSNLYKQFPTTYNDLGVFGTNAFALVEDEQSLFRCYDFPIGSYYLANDARRQVRVFVHEFQMTVRQLVERFGRVNGRGAPDWSKFSATVKNAWDRGSYEIAVDVVTVVRPNEEADERYAALSARHRAFASCTYEKGSRTDVYLEETGYDEFPIIASRWEVTGQDVYGTWCPGMMALGDVRQLQGVERTVLKAIEKAVNPPLVMPIGNRNTTVSQLPGGVTYVEDPTGKQARPLVDTSAFRLDWAEAKQQQVRERINESFYTPLFLAVTQMDRENVTAREIDERHEEKLLMIGPVVVQSEGDLHRPVIERTYAIMDRKGMFPTPPEELHGMALDIQYLSIMAQAQKTIGLEGHERFAFTMVKLSAEAQRPDLLDKVNFDQWTDTYADQTGTLPNVVVPTEQAAQVRKARADAAQAQQAAQQAQLMAGTAQTLSQTDTSGQNGLTDLLKQAQVGQ
jgi:hypothetical protein